MRIRCLLSELRGTESLRSIAEKADVNPGDLSKIEAGMMLPKDEDVPALQRAYGAPVTSWYPPAVLLALESDDIWLQMLRERMHDAWLRS